MKTIRYLSELNGVKKGEKVNPIYTLGCENTRFLERRENSFIGGELFESGAMITKFEQGSSGIMSIASHYYKATEEFPDYDKYKLQLEAIIENEN